jgi:hypothetical protein
VHQHSCGRLPNAFVPAPCVWPLPLSFRFRLTLTVYW